MINLRDIRYVRLGTADLEGASHYATRILGLEPARGDSRARYFRGDAREHTLAFFAGDPSDHTVAFEVDRTAELDAAGAALDALDFPVHWGSAEDCEQRRVAALLRTDGVPRPATDARPLDRIGPPR